jgi:hypothetical protein
MKIKIAPLDEKGFSHGIILVIFVEKWIFQEHFLKWTFIFDWEFTSRRFVVTFLMNNGVDDVEEHFLFWSNRLRTNRAAQFANDFEHIYSP